MAEDSAALVGAVGRVSAEQCTRKSYQIIRTRMTKKAKINIDIQMSKNDFGISQEVVEALQTDKTTSNLIKHVYNFRF